MRYLVYRLLYGEDFIKQSILSMVDHVDKVIVFAYDRPWGNVKQVRYKNMIVRFPVKFDFAIERVAEINSPKIEIVYPDYTPTPFNQFTDLLNQYVLGGKYDHPDTVLIAEHDHVFRSDQIEAALTEFEESTRPVAMTRQIELWRRPWYAIPERARTGVVFWDTRTRGPRFGTAIPTTGTQGEVRGDTQLLNSYVHNLGFCMEPKNMYWKHLLALAFSPIIGDSIPGEGWFDRWQNWTMADHNLEIASGHEHKIPRAYDYNTAELPEIIQEELNGAASTG